MPVDRHQLTATIKTVEAMFREHEERCVNAIAALPEGFPTGSAPVCRLGLLTHPREVRIALLVIPLPTVI